MKKTHLILLLSALTGWSALVFSQTAPPPPPGGDTDVDAPERPERPARTELTVALKDKLSSYKAEHDSLRNELKALIKQLNRPTREKIREITKKFEADNQTRIQAQKELAHEIKTGLKEARPERPAKPQISDETIKLKVDLLRKQHKEINEAVKESTIELKTQLETATREQRKELLDAFREDQKKLHQDLKNIQRQIREALQPAITASTSGVRTNNRRPPSRDDVVTDVRRESDR
jgi:DNA repair exonuclease SbcCD ATPase subunit